jgi:flagellar hook-associated protein 3 FlgL
MTPIGSSSIGTAWFLNGIASLQQQEVQTQRQISSGYKVQDASDAPAQTADLVNLGSSLARTRAYQTNLSGVQVEAQSADQALASATTLLDSARVLAQQGANTTATASDRQTLALQVQNIQDQIVSISNTTVAGRYIFGGDQDQSPPYQSNNSAASGVNAPTAQSASRTIVNPQGFTVYQPLTANQIFNPTDNTGAPTANNTLVALQSLKTALQANDQPGISAALTSLQTADNFVSQQQAVYGVAEQRITTELNNSANSVTSLNVQIGAIRDTDVVQAASDLTQEATRQSAAFGAEASMPKKSLFDYLG